MLRLAIAVEMTSVIGWLVTSGIETRDAENEHLLYVIVDTVRG
jgi:hypothetical protein